MTGHGIGLVGLGVFLGYYLYIALNYSEVRNARLGEKATVPDMPLEDVRRAVERHRHTPTPAQVRVQMARDRCGRAPTEANRRALAEAEKALEEET